MTTAREEAERRWPGASFVISEAGHNGEPLTIFEASRQAFEAGAEWQARQPRRAGDSVAAAIGHRILGGENPIDVARDYDAVQPVEITDDMVERAARSLRDDRANRVDNYEVPAWEDTSHDDKLVFRGQARAALEAALGGEQ